MVREPVEACHLLLLQFFTHCGKRYLMVFALPVQRGSQLCHDRDCEKLIFCRGWHKPQKADSCSIV